MRWERVRGEPLQIFPALAAGVVVLGAAAPWLLGFSQSHAAVANSIAFAMAFAPLALMITALRAAAAACIAGGAWLAASPFALGYASAGLAAWATGVVLGVSLAAIAYRTATYDLE
jgi:hypothetical protein